MMPFPEVPFVTGTEYPLPLACPFERSVPSKPTDDGPASGAESKETEKAES